MFLLLTLNMQLPAGFETGRFVLLAILRPLRLRDCKTAILYGLDPALMINQNKPFKLFYSYKFPQPWYQLTPVSFPSIGYVIILQLALFYAFMIK